jgi:outer membrane lipoprotein SlyB
MKKLLLIATLALSACAQLPGQNQYGYQDVGKTSIVEFGTVVSSRKVEITGKNTGAGALVGAAAGAGGGSYIGSGTGNVWATLGIALAGAIAGHMTEQALADHGGIEYIVSKDSGQTIGVVQNQKAEDIVFQKGQRVMVQTEGGYQRVLPAVDTSTKQETRP